MKRILGGIVLALLLLATMIGYRWSKQAAAYEITWNFAESVIQVYLMPFEVPPVGKISGMICPLAAEYEMETWAVYVWRPVEGSGDSFVPELLVRGETADCPPPTEPDIQPPKDPSDRLGI